jgi:transcriptional regulator with XRE-family HTH domain
MITNKFGLYLRNLRLEKRFSLNQLALKSGVSNAHISRIERGLRPAPSPEIIEKLANALNANYEEMLVVAGYLPEQNKKNPQHPNVEDEDIVAFLRAAEDLTEDEKREVLAYIEFRKAQRRKKKDNE